MGGSAKLGGANPIRVKTRMFNNFMRTKGKGGKLVNKEMSGIVHRVKNTTLSTGAELFYSGILVCLFPRELSYLFLETMPKIDFPFKDFNGFAFKRSQLFVHMYSVDKLMCMCINKRSKIESLKIESS
jgi:hypothetical protein